MDNNINQINYNYQTTDTASRIRQYDIVKEFFVKFDKDDIMNTDILFKTLESSEGRYQDQEVNEKLLEQVKTLIDANSTDWLIDKNDNIHIKKGIQVSFAKELYNTYISTLQESFNRIELDETEQKSRLAFEKKLFEETLKEQDEGNSKELFDYVVLKLINLQKTKIVGEAIKRTLESGNVSERDENLLNNLYEFGAEWRVDKESAPDISEAMYEAIREGMFSSKKMGAGLLRGALMDKELFGEERSL